MGSIPNNQKVLAKALKVNTSHPKAKKQLIEKLDDYIKTGNKETGFVLSEHAWRFHGKRGTRERHLAQQVPNGDHSTNAETVTAEFAQKVKEDVQTVKRITYPHMYIGNGFQGNIACMLSKVASDESADVKKRTSARQWLSSMKIPEHVTNFWKVDPKTIDVGSALADELIRTKETWVKAPYDGMVQLNVANKLPWFAGQVMEPAKTSWQGIVNSMCVEGSPGRVRLAENDVGIMFSHHLQAHFAVNLGAQGNSWAKFMAKDISEVARNRPSVITRYYELGQLKMYAWACSTMQRDGKHVYGVSDNVRLDTKDMTTMQSREERKAHSREELKKMELSVAQLSDAIDATAAAMTADVDPKFSAEVAESAAASQRKTLATTEDIVFERAQSRVRKALGSAATPSNIQSRMEHLGTEVHGIMLGASADADAAAPPIFVDQLDEFASHAPMGSTGHSSKILNEILNMKYGPPVALSEIPELGFVAFSGDLNQAIKKKLTWSKDRVKEIEVSTRITDAMRDVKNYIVIDLKAAATKNSIRFFTKAPHVLTTVGSAALGKIPREHIRQPINMKSLAAQIDPSVIAGHSAHAASNNMSDSRGRDTGSRYFSRNDHRNKRERTRSAEAPKKSHRGKYDSDRTNRNWRN